MVVVTLALGAATMAVVLYLVLCRVAQTPLIDALRRAGRALGGTVTRAPDGTFQLDALVAGQSVHLGYQMVLACGIRPQLFAQVAVSDHTSQIDVHPRGSSSCEASTQNALEAEDHPSGDHIFDAAYQVRYTQTSPLPIPPEARRLMVETGPVRVRLSDGQLEVRPAEPAFDAPTVLNVARIAGIYARAYARA